MAKHSNDVPKVILDVDTWGEHEVDLESVCPLTKEGTLLLEFSTTIDGTLLVMDGTNGRIELRIEGGRLNGDFVFDGQQRWLDAEDALGLDDGHNHCVGLSANESGLHIFVDGYEAFSATLAAWFDALDVTSLVVDPDRIMNPIRLRVWDRPLSLGAVAAASPAAKPFLQFAASQLSDRDAQRCGSLSQGALRARFRTRGEGQGGAIIAAGGSRGHLELGVENGDLYYRLVSDGVAVADVVSPGHYDNGDWHDIILVSGRGAIDLYADGTPLIHVPGEAFFADLGDISRVTVGANLDGIRLFGEAQTAYIYDAVLSDFQIKRLVGAEPIPTRALFDTGLKGSKSYRIPSLITLKSGVVIAGADQRVSIANDSPNDINFVIRRSLDGGNTWEDPQTLIVYPGSGRLGASVIDSVIVQDEESGRVIVLIDHFPGGIGQPNCKVGTGHDEQGRRLLFDKAGRKYSLAESGVVLDEHGVTTEYRVEDNGDVFVGSEQRGNIHLAEGVDPNESLLSVRTCYLQMIYSDDDGETWSQPIDITAQVKKDWNRFFGTSPGNGIQIKKGPHKGRILIPVYYNHEEGITFSCAVIYTDDAGRTWHLGDSPNDGRELFGKTISSRDLNDDIGSLHESAIIEGKSGNIHVYMRNQHPSGRVAHAVSEDGGQTWGEVDYVEQLTEIFSQPNAINFTFRDGREAFIFANASQMLPFRGCGVLRVSFDDGRTWPHNRVFNPRHYVYQCMAQLPNGKLGLLWEREWQGLFFSEIDEEWLTASLSTIS